MFKFYLQKLGIIALVFFLSANLSNCSNNTSDKPKITIVGGTGAVGGYIASKLLSNSQLSIIGRSGSPHLLKIQSEGLVVKTSTGDKKTAPTRFKFVGEDFNKITEKQDFIIVCLKQPHMTAEIAQQIISISDSKTLIAFVSNGVPFFFMNGLNQKKDHIHSIDYNGKIAHLFKNRNIIFLHPIIASWVKSPGVIEVLTPEDRINFFIAPIFSTSSNLEILAQVLNISGIKTEVTDTSAHKIILEKLQFALAINIMSGLLSKSNGDIFYDPELQSFIKYIILLTNSIGKAFNVEGLRGYEQFKKIKITRTHFSSFYHDLKAEKSSEGQGFANATLELLGYIQSQHLGEVPDLSPLLILKSLIEKRVRKETIQPKDIKLLLDKFNTALLATKNY